MDRKLCILGIYHLFFPGPDMIFVEIFMQFNFEKYGNLPIFLALGNDKSRFAQCSFKICIFYAVQEISWTNEREHSGTHLKFLPRFKSPRGMRAFTTSFAFPGAEDLLHTNTTDSLLFHRKEAKERWICF